MNKVDQLVGRSVGINIEEKKPAKKHSTTLMHLIGEIRNKENSTARKVGESVVLVLYFLSGLFLAEALGCLGNWMWSEIKRGLSNHKRTAELKNILINDVKTKATKAILPLAYDILNKLMSRPKVVETIDYVTSLGVATGTGALKDVLNGRVFCDAKKVAIDSVMSNLGETGNTALKDFNTVFGIAEKPAATTPPAADKAKPEAKNPSVEKVKKIIFDELETLVMQPFYTILGNASDAVKAAFLGTSEKEEIAPIKPTATAKVKTPEEDNTAALESQGAQMVSWLKALVKETPGSDAPKQGPVVTKVVPTPTTGAIPEINAIKDKFLANLKKQAPWHVRYFLGQLY